MKTKLMATTALISSLTLPAPAFAIGGISYDGSSMDTAYQDPQFVAGNPAGLRYGGFSIRLSSIGQVNDGYVQLYTTMYPSNQYDGPFKIRFLTPETSDENLGDGESCPNLSWDIDNHMGNNSDGSLDIDQLRQYQYENCDIRPDPHLFASGAKMWFQLLISSPDGGWFNAIWHDAIPMDGAQYTITLTWGVGEAGVGPPYAKLLVTKRGGPPATIADPDYLDASYYYNSPNDGFDVPFSGVFWQGGCDTTDPSYVNTCVTALVAERWIQPANDLILQDISPIATFLAFFLSANNDAAPFLGTYGQMLTGFPPAVYNTGNDPTFLINSADLGYINNTQVPQISISQAWSQDGTSNLNFEGLGAGIQAAGQDF